MVFSSLISRQDPLLLLQTSNGSSNGTVPNRCLLKKPNHFRRKVKEGQPLNNTITKKEMQKIGHSTKTPRW